MTTVKLKIRINNSYESELSSESGSSKSNESENATCEEPASNLQHMLDPHLYFEDQAPFPEGKKIESRCLNQYKTQFNTSDESDFEGFTDSEIEKQRSIPMSEKSGTTSVQLARVKKYEQPMPSSKPYSNLFDVFIEQDSCNAVDINLSHNNKAENSEGVINLSFDGKITNLASNTFGIPSKDSFKDLQANPIVNTIEITNLKYAHERSPDLFEDDDGSNCERDRTIPLEENVHANLTKISYYPRDSSFADEHNDNTLYESETALRQSIQREKELLKRIKTCLAGIPPPPSLTIPQVDVISAVIQNRADILRFRDDVIASKCSENRQKETSLFIISHSVDELKTISWPDSLSVRQHGLCYNICRASENIELLNLAIIERFVGSETSTSYTFLTSSPSSAKKRNLRQKMLTKSPGNRLSHLAKRRAIFSSANLATTSQKSSNCTLGMQILLDKKITKTRRKGSTPKRMTPNTKNTGARKTPSSSARKRLSFQSHVVRVVPSRESSKRALFQSPAKHKKISVAATSKPSFKTDIAIRVEKSKRALFSPEKLIQGSTTPFIMSNTNEFSNLSQTSQSSLFGGELDSFILKRKRVDEDPSDLKGNQSKMFRYETESLTPRALKIKSQSFCIGAGSTNNISGLTSVLRDNISSDYGSLNSRSNNTGRSITRASSDVIFPSSNQLTENHRKKLLWAVSQALQAKQVSVTHADFKKCASVLARVVRRIFQEYFQKSSSSTSETMLRLAKKYVYSVISGKSADDIYLYAKSKLEDERRMHKTRISGYISPGEFENRKTVATHSLHNFENRSTNMLANPSACVTRTECWENSENSTMDEYNGNSAIKLPIQPNANLQNSSSKNNLGGTALRENLDTEQRRSAQKNFTGKDQRNVSPYVNSIGRSSKKTMTFGSNVYGLNQCTIRAKRQISFDS